MSNSNQSTITDNNEHEDLDSLILSMRIFSLLAFLLWFICTILLYRQQLKLQAQRRMNDKFLELETEDDGEVQYLISFFTGSNYKTPPTGKVRLHMLGSLFPGKFHDLCIPPSYEEEEHENVDDDDSGDSDSSASTIPEKYSPHLFPPHCREKFIVSEDVSLGRIMSIILSTEVTGENPTWECKSVIVRDLNTNQAWYFEAKCTIGFPPVILTPATEEELTSFKRSWQRRVRREVRHGQYIYFGFWFKLDHSTYTFFQRQITAVTTQLLLFSLCALFVGIILPLIYTHNTQSQEDISNEPDIKYWVKHTIVGAFIASICTSCIGYLLVALFREKNKYEKKFYEMDYVIGTALHEHDRAKEHHLFRDCNHYDPVLKRCNSTISTSSISSLQTASSTSIDLKILQNNSKEFQKPAELSAINPQNKASKTEIIFKPVMLAATLNLNLQQENLGSETPAIKEPSIWNSVYHAFKKPFATRKVSNPPPPPPNKENNLNTRPSHTARWKTRLVNFNPIIAAADTKSAISNKVTTFAKSLYSMATNVFSKSTATNKISPLPETSPSTKSIVPVDENNEFSSLQAIISKSSDSTNSGIQMIHDIDSTHSRPVRPSVSNLLVDNSISTTALGEKSPDLSATELFQKIQFTLENKTGNDVPEIPDVPDSKEIPTELIKSQSSKKSKKSLAKPSSKPSNQKLMLIRQISSSVLMMKKSSAWKRKRMQKKRARMRRLFLGKRHHRDQIRHGTVSLNVISLPLTPESLSVLHGPESATKLQKQKDIENAKHLEKTQEKKYADKIVLNRTSVSKKRGRKFPRPIPAWTAVFIINLISIAIISVIVLNLIGNDPVKNAMLLHLHIFLTTYLTSLFLGTFIIETLKMTLIGAYYAYNDKNIYKRITKEAKARQKFKRRQSIKRNIAKVRFGNVFSV